MDLLAVAAPDEAMAFLSANSAGLQAYTCAAQALDLGHRFD
jgi:hypothetical protein